MKLPALSRRSLAARCGRMPRPKKGRFAQLKVVRAGASRGVLPAFVSPGFAARHARGSSLSCRRCLAALIILLRTALFWQHAQSCNKVKSCVVSDPELKSRAGGHVAMRRVSTVWHPWSQRILMSFRPKTNSRVENSRSVVAVVSFFCATDFDFLCTTLTSCIWVSVSQAAVKIRRASAACF